MPVLKAVGIELSGEPRTTDIGRRLNECKERGMQRDRKLWSASEVPRIVGA
jgi:tetrahydromethanopterin S-methyltransferase subunit F